MYWGVDCGTQGSKVVIPDPDQGGLRGEGYAPHLPIGEAHGRREQEPRWWVDAFRRACRETLEQAGIDSRAIRAIGVSGQQHDLVALDAAGGVIRRCPRPAPACWLTCRTNLSRTLMEDTTVG